MLIKRNCFMCGKEFMAQLYYIKKGRGKYCSCRCSNQVYKSGMKGKTQSAESRKKMSLAKKGKHPNPAGEFKKGHVPATFIGRMINSQGYVSIFSPEHPYKTKGKYVKEHRLVVEKMINRFLLPEEKVHHVDEVKGSNHPKNLICFASESAHQRFHSNPLNVKPNEIIFDGRLICTSP